MYRRRLSLAALLLFTIVIGTAAFAYGFTHWSLAALSTIFFPNYKLGWFENAHQGIVGNATIDYWAVNLPPVTNRRGPDLNVTNSDGQTVQFPLIWNSTKFALGSGYFSTFRIELKPGIYSINIADVGYPHCYKPQPGVGGGFACNLPYEVTVEPDHYSTVLLGVGGGL